MVPRALSNWKVWVQSLGAVEKVPQRWAMMSVGEFELGGFGAESDGRSIKHRGFNTMHYLEVDVSFLYKNLLDCPPATDKQGVQTEYLSITHSKQNIHMETLFVFTGLFLSGHSAPAWEPSKPFEESVFYEDFQSLGPTDLCYLSPDNQPKDSYLTVLCELVLNFIQHFFQPIFFAISCQMTDHHYMCDPNVKAHLVSKTWVHLDY